MQLELDMSIPILKKYANIMSIISGIDEDILIYELTLPEEEINKAKEQEKEKEKEKETETEKNENEDNKEKEKKEEEILNNEEEKSPTLTNELIKQYLNNPKFKDYKPIGLPILVQNSVFNIKPSNKNINENKKENENEIEYNKEQVLLQLKQLEKEVIQFQIDYKKKKK